MYSSSGIPIIFPEAHSSNVYFEASGLAYGCQLSGSAGPWLARLLSRRLDRLIHACKWTSEDISLLKMNQTCLLWARRLEQMKLSLPSGMAQYRHACPSRLRP